jgi:membrane-associated phospholipid phosphatase
MQEQPSRRRGVIFARTVPAWSQAWAERRFRWTFYVTALLAVLSPVVTPKIYTVVQRRPGKIPPDPLLPLLGPVSVSAAILILISGTLAIVVAGCLHRPQTLIRGGIACVVLFSMRMITMALVPLASPPGQIALRDPVGQLFYPGKVPDTRDLFFSGHTAMMVLLIALVRSRLAKLAVAVVAVSVGVLLLVQHVHWTVDVLAAPLFAAAAWWLSGFVVSTARLQERSWPPLEFSQEREG